jgi:hypothetical protein
VRPLSPGPDPVFIDVLLGAQEKRRFLLTLFQLRLCGHEERMDG